MHDSMDFTILKFRMHSGLMYQFNLLTWDVEIVRQLAPLQNIFTAYRSISIRISHPAMTVPIQQYRSTAANVISPEFLFLILVSHDQRSDVLTYVPSFFRRCLNIPLIDRFHLIILLILLFPFLRPWYCHPGSASA